MSFQHQELDGNDQFRVLELLPAASRDEALEFRIHHVAFSKHPGYAAISYTWDDQEPNQTALCNNRGFKISQNCDKILRRLRPPFSYSSVFLWIDQICINQVSYSDKAINVRQMGAIYQQAKTVLVWTGEYDSKLSEEVVTAAHECGDLGAIPYTITEHWHVLYGTTRRSTLSTPKPTSFTTSSTQRHGRGPRKRRQDSLDVLYSFQSTFSNKKWFKRMWTLQEAIVPLPHHVYFLIGKYTVPLDILNDSKYGLAHDFYSIRLTNEDRGLAEMLYTARNRQCKDPRDKYFALYSISRRSNINLRDDFPEPDYNQSTKDVYIEWAYWALTKMKDARILYLSVLSESELRATEPTSVLPSWVPDPFRLSFLNRNKRNSFFPSVESDFDATPKSIPNFDITADRWFGDEKLVKLKARGKIIDEIIITTDEIPESQLKLDDYDQWQRQLMSILQDFVYRAFELGIFDRGWISGVDAFWRAVLHVSQLNNSDMWREQCLRYVFSEKASLYEESKQSKRYRDLVCDVTGRRLPTMAVPSTSWPSSAPLASGNDLPKGMRSGSANVIVTFSEVEKHKIIITKSKRVGLVIGAIRTGDKVAFCSGLSKVLVLRPIGKFFSLIGHGFIDGFMTGEAWSNNQTETSDLVLI
ncbi:heterokaryon incompatibility protein-domain-containing protein [Nemania sp. FL0031]|nr:heterokaryon incompatibility protein-domain-containing protein [Nemania sp. FL0031]